jgi:hypothetical protein
MPLLNETSAGRLIVAAVCVALISMLAAGSLIGYWTAEAMTAVVTEQFNAQQMVIAQTVKARIEREFNAVKHEIFLMARLLQGNPEPRAETKDALQQALTQLAELGVRKVEIVDRADRRVRAGTLLGPWIERSLLTDSLFDTIRFPADGRQPLRNTSAGMPFRCVRKNSRTSPTNQSTSSKRKKCSRASRARAGFTRPGIAGLPAP